MAQSEDTNAVTSEFLVVFDLYRSDHIYFNVTVIFDQSLTKALKCERKPRLKRKIIFAVN